MGNPSDQYDWHYDIADDISLLIAKPVTHPHYADAIREMPEIERALARAKAYLEGTQHSSAGAKEATMVLDDVAIALGRVQARYGR